jgi:colanic acid biosynthesis glycosyl transferase WcaI
MSSILLISYNYHPELTGIGKYNTEFCEHIVSLGHKVTVITAYPYYPYWKLYKNYRNIFFKSEFINGVKVIRCPIYIPKNPSGIKRILLDFSYYFSSLFVVLYYIVTFKNIDYVISPSPSFLSGLHGILLKSFNPKRKIAYHVQDLQIDAALELGLLSKNNWIKNQLLSIEFNILKNSDYISTISEGMKLKIAEKGIPLKKILLFPNWVDSNDIFPITSDKSILSYLNLPSNKKFFLYSGSLGEKQGLEIIFEIAKSVSISCPDLYFVICGSGPMKSSFVEKIKINKIVNIQLVELQPKEVFNQLLNMAFCHLVIQKNVKQDLFLPSKLANILAVGGLCIVTANPGCSLYDLIENNKMGVLVPAESAENFKIALEEMYNEVSDGFYCRNSILSYKKNALKFAINHLQKNNVINSFLTKLGLFTSVKVLRDTLILSED